MRKVFWILVLFSLTCTLPGVNPLDWLFDTLFFSPPRTLSVPAPEHDGSYELVHSNSGLNDWVVVEFRPRTGVKRHVVTLLEDFDLHVEDIRLNPTREGLEIAYAFSGSAPSARLLLGREELSMVGSGGELLFGGGKRSIRPLSSGWSCGELVDSILFGILAWFFHVPARGESGDSRDGQVGTVS